jgi:hypothetical protein
VQVLALSGLGDDPVAAAARFYAQYGAQAQTMAAQGDLALVFPVADHTHRAWRLAAVQGLARGAVPHRVNALEGPPVQAAIDYLAGAAGVTGQLLPIDGQGAGTGVS